MVSSIVYLYVNIVMRKMKNFIEKKGISIFNYNIIIRLIHKKNQNFKYQYLKFWFYIYISVMPVSLFLQYGVYI